MGPRIGSGQPRFMTWYRFLGNGECAGVTHGPEFYKYIYSIHVRSFVGVFHP